MGESDIFIKTVLVLGKDTIQVDGSHSNFCRVFFALGSQRDRCHYYCCLTGDVSNALLSNSELNL